MHIADDYPPNAFRGADAVTGIGKCNVDDKVIVTGVLATPANPNSMNTGVVCFSADTCRELGNLVGMVDGAALVAAEARVADLLTQVADADKLTEALLSSLEAVRALAPKVTAAKRTSAPKPVAKSAAPKKDLL